MERRPVRCAIYTRQSVVRPNGTDFTSCEAQREACLELIRAHAPEGWIPIDERFDDAGESGATINRPALARLLERIASGEVDRVVVQRLDRLTRSVSDYAELVGTFKRRGTKLTIVVGDIHLGDAAMDDLVLNILATFAEFERELIGERLRDARAALRSRGIRNAGRVPFGYSSDPLSHQLVVQPEEASVVKRVFEMVAAGAAPSAVAAWINTQGESNWRILNGRQPWSAKAVLRVLSNRVYLGRMGAVADAHDAIVDEQLFAKARAAIDGRRTRAPTERPGQAGDLFLLRRLLRCVHCARLMTTSSSRALPEAPMGPKPSKVAPLPRHYRCRGQKSCRGTQVAADDIEQRVLAWLRKPNGKVSAEALTVLTAYEPIWEVLFPETVRRSVDQLVWEVRWDGLKNEFDVGLDETAIADAHASITRRKEERANLPNRVVESASARDRGERPKPRVRACSRRLLRGTLLSVPPASVATYRKDPVYPRVARAVDGLLNRGTVVTPVDVLIGMGLLTREQLEDWRRGRVPYLERVINCNLTRLSRLLRRWGKGPKQRLRFTKTGDAKLEEAYATHFVWPGKSPFHPPASKEGAQ